MSPTLRGGNETPRARDAAREPPADPEALFRRKFKKWVVRLLADQTARNKIAAAEAVDQMLREHPNRPEVHRTVAEYHLAQHNVAAAIASFERALDLDPTERVTRIRLAQIHAALGRPMEAVHVLEPAAEKLTKEAHCELAVLYAKNGRVDDAVDILNRVIERSPAFLPAREELINVLEGAGRLTEAEAGRRARDLAIPPKLSLVDVVERIESARPGETYPYVVNIGCRDGRSMGDPCYELYQAGYPGLAVDAGPFPQLYLNLPQPEVRKLLYTPLTPMNVCGVLRREGCPTRLTLLKIDIDSYDGVLLQEILKEFEPSVVQIEVNPEIPPPIQFSIQYDPRYRHSGAYGFFGCSVAFITALGRRHGYQLLQIDLGDPPRRQDVILVKEQYLAVFGVAIPHDERALYLEEPPTLTGRFRRIGYDSVEWRERTDYHALMSEIWDALVEGSMKRSNKVLPFILTSGD